MPRPELLVPAVAAIRTAQGLTRHGYPAAAIADMAEVPVTAVRMLHAGRKRLILPRIERPVRMLGMRVRLDVLPSGPSANTARAQARRRNWMPLAAWDESTIGDPDALPDLGMPGDDFVDEVAVERALAGVPVALNKPERACAVQAALARGLTESAAAVLLRMNLSTFRSFAEHGMSPVARKQAELDAAVADLGHLGTTLAARRLGVAEMTIVRSRQRLAERHSIAS